MQVSTTDQLRAGQVGRLRILLDSEDRPGDWTFTLNVGADPNNPFPDDGVKHRMRRGSDFEPEVTFVGEGRKTLTATQPATASQPEINHEFEFDVLPEQLPPVPTTNVALVVPDAPRSEDEILWSFINQITNRMRFEEFHEFVKPRLVGRGGPEWYGTDAFRRLRKAAEDFVGIAADPLGAVDDAERTVVNELTRSTVLGGLDRSYVSSEGADLAQPFLRFATPNGDRPSRRQFAPRGQQNGKVEFPLPNVPFVELIWNYWHEEGMLVQSLNRILARFQNRRVGPGHDSLSRFDLNPLLPLRNLLWGFVEDETRRLTVRRRAAEYQYQYGLRLVGRAVPPADRVVERRTQFLEAFHSLLHASHGFFKERDDLTVAADAFSLLSSLREVHLVLARGAHNQFADLPLAARAEMLTMQWLLAQPEMREFLGGPTMVPYEEPWMDRVDTMKTLNGWSDASITHFFELAVHGEQIVLSVRHGRWNEAGRTREDAANWALTWRNEIQRYIHAYRTVTGVDLATGIDATMPSELLARRLAQQDHR